MLKNEKNENNYNRDNRSTYMVKTKPKDTEIEEAEINTLIKSSALLMGLEISKSKLNVCIITVLCKFVMFINSFNLNND